jgi:hypothetical protein
LAIRPIYISTNNSANYVKTVDIKFTWHSGFSKSQKQKSIKSLHKEIRLKFPSSNILEISSKSLDLFGVNLSAFNLIIEGKLCNYSVESAFQSSKIFESGGPYIDLLEKSSIDAKKDIRLKNSGKLIGFSYQNQKWPLTPKTIFYDWLYLNALNQNSNSHYIPELLNYDTFTDIEFNPTKSINCQAKSAALFVSLYNDGRLGSLLESKEKFIEFFSHGEQLSVL